MPYDRITFRHSKGFTLLELVVVVFLIALISSVTMLSIGDAGQGRQFENEIKRMELLLGLAAEEAIVRGESIGLSLSEVGYRYLLHEEGQWIALADPSPFRQHQLPPFMTLDLIVGGQNRHLSSLIPPDPQVVFHPTGEVTGCIVRLIGKEAGTAVMLVVGHDGQITRQEDEGVL
ncbi:MAG: GspH/FimT family pseudopilin [Sedimenticola sp.]